MSELVTARISAHAARLGLHQLAATAPALTQRAHDAQLGDADFLDLILGEETAAKDDRRFASALDVRPAPPQDPRRLRLHLPARPRHPQDQGPRHPGLRRHPGRQRRPARPAGNRQDAPGLRPGRRRLRRRALRLLHQPR